MVVSTGTQLYLCSSCAIMQNIRVERTSYYQCCLWRLHGESKSLTALTLLNSAGPRGQHRCNTRLGGWTQINTRYQKEKQSVNMYVCVMVGDVPNSGYMLRFTQNVHVFDIAHRTL